MTQLLKISSAYITSLLNHITSLLSGAFPQCLKYSIAKSLFKTCDRTDISNYRPIFILTSFSKILEKYYITNYLNT
jgi:hypothetical protein